MKPKTDHGLLSKKKKKKKLEKQNTNKKYPVDSLATRVAGFPLIPL